MLWSDVYEINSNTELIFFTQYERDIDKFKPSRSGFVTGIYRDSWEEQVDGATVHKEEWSMYYLIKTLKFMKKHPIKAYVYSGMQTTRICEELSGFMCFRVFIRDWFYDKKCNVEKYIQLKRQLNACKHLFNKVKDRHYIMVILRPDNWYPRLDIRVRRKNLQNFEKILRDEEVFSKFEEKWFNSITIEQNDLEIKESYTDEEMQEDNDLKNRFVKGVTYHYTDEDGGYEILYSNCEELVCKEIV